MALQLLQATARAAPATSHGSAGWVCVRRARAGPEGLGKLTVHDILEASKSGQL